MILRWSSVPGPTTTSPSDVDTGDGFDAGLEAEVGVDAQPTRVPSEIATAAIRSHLPILSLKSLMRIEGQKISHATTCELSATKLVIICIPARWLFSG
jgi:hypothetical protein